MNAPTNNDLSKLTRLTEIQVSSTPEGAAAVHLWRAEDHLATRADRPTLLVQVVPVSEFWKEPKEIVEILYRFFENSGRSRPLVRGLGWQVRDTAEPPLWELQIDCNGYVGMALFAVEQGDTWQFLNDPTLNDLRQFREWYMKTDLHATSKLRVRCVLLHGPVEVRSDQRKENHVEHFLLDRPRRAPKEVPEDLDTVDILLSGSQ